MSAELTALEGLAHLKGYRLVPLDGGEAAEAGNWKSLVMAAHRQHVRHLLTTHYLAQVICDHERKMDNPVCACSLVHLGWHPSVGAAVEAWADHVMSLLEEP